MKIYLSHPISNLKPDEYLPIFAKWEEALKDDGFEVINPTTLPAHQHHDQRWSSFMLADLAELSTCDAMLMLCPADMWLDSVGCEIEVMWASRDKITVYYTEDLLALPIMYARSCPGKEPSEAVLSLITHNSSPKKHTVGIQ